MHERSLLGTIPDPYDPCISVTFKFAPSELVLHQGWPVSGSLRDKNQSISLSDWLVNHSCEKKKPRLLEKWKLETSQTDGARPSGS